MGKFNIGKQMAVTNDSWRPIVPKHKHCWYAQNLYSYRVFFSFLPKIFRVIATPELINEVKVIHHYVIEEKFLVSNSENHDGFRNLFTALIELSWRLATVRVTKGNHSIEIRCTLEKELLKTTLFLTFGIVYHPLKIAPATRWNMLLHKRFGRYRLYVMATHECLTRFPQFVRHCVRLCASTSHKHHEK